MYYCDANDASYLAYVCVCVDCGIRRRTKNSYNLSFVSWMKREHSEKRRSWFEVDKCTKINWRKSDAIVLKHGNQKVHKDRLFDRQSELNEYSLFVLNFVAVYFRILNSHVLSSAYLNVSDLSDVCVFFFWYLVFLASQIIIGDRTSPNFAFWKYIIYDGNDWEHLWWCVIV